MKAKFKAVSLSHREAPLDIRELFALDEDSMTNLLKDLKEYTEVSDLLILSTCNRIEVYYSADSDLGLEIIKRIGIEKNIENPSQYKPYFSFYNHSDSVNQLFNVALGLKSKVLGDLHIINQVKKAYQLSADEGVAGPFLHRLMHTIFSTHKRVVRETAFKDGAASVSYVTVKLAQRLATSIKNPTILILGLGEMGADICRHFTKTNLKNIWLGNRTFEKAQALGKECGYQALTFKQGLQKIREADLVISSLAAKRPIIENSLLKKKEASPQYFIDLSVPRSIAPEVHKTSGVKIYNIDSIQEEVTQVLTQRRQVKPEVEVIIKESITNLRKWSEEMAYAPVINKMKQALEQIRREELKRYLKKMPPEARETVEQVTKSMIQKIVKLPVLKLKANCQRDQAENLSEVLSQLFDLEGHLKDQSK